MYRSTTAASGCSAYRSESGSFSATRQVRWRLSQNAVQQWWAARNAATCSAAPGAGRLSGSVMNLMLVHLVH